MVNRSNRAPCWSTPLISGESLPIGRTLQAEEICDYRAHAVAGGLFQNQNYRMEQPNCEVIVSKYNSYGKRFSGWGGATEYRGAIGLHVRGGRPSLRDESYMKGARLIAWIRKACLDDWKPLTQKHLEATVKIMKYELEYLSGLEPERRQKRVNWSFVSIAELKSAIAKWEPRI